MSYTTKVIYSTDSNFTNTQNVSKSGKPDSIELKNLTSNQNYYTKAELEDNNGTLLDTSDVLTFQTLAAGTISLSYVSTTRSGNDYIASFTYTSTYALSSAIMLINSVNVQGVIEGNNITFTISGLTHGNTYSYTITATDIYTETGTLSGSITTTHDYSQDYFTIKNESNTFNSIYMGPNSSTSYKTITLYVSTDNGANWKAKTTGKNAITLATLEQGKSLLVKHTGALSENGKYNQFRSDGNYSVSGNIASLCFGDNFNTGSALTMPDYAYTELFSFNVYNQAAKLVSVENLDFSSYTAVSTYGMYGMFRDCTSLTTAPDLSSITSVGNYGMWDMFSTCTSLTTAPDLSSITSVGYYGMVTMFYNCTSLKTAPDLSNITTVGTQGMWDMFANCTSLTTAPDLSNITTVDIQGMYNMFQNCTSLITAPDLSSITSVGHRGMMAMFYGCTSLKTAYAPTITWNTTNTSEWLSGVAASGTLYADPSIASSIPTSNVSGCPTGWTVKAI